VMLSSHEKYLGLTDEERDALLKKWGYSVESIEEKIVWVNYERLKDRMIITETGIEIVHT
jgi:hypothetical protein